MIFALAKFSAAFEQFNRRALGETEFFEMCEAESISVVFDEMPVLQGFTAKLQNRKFIFLDRNLRGTELLWVAFHELAHAVLHEPRSRKTGVNFFSLCRPTKEDDEADAIALAAIYPTCILKDLEISAPSDFPFERDLIERRMRMFSIYGV